MQIIKIGANGCVHIPKKARLLLHIREGDKMIMRTNGDSICFVRMGLMNVIEEYLQGVDEELAELFYKEKKKR